MSDPASETRCAIVAVIGAPNAGKSTLVNRLVGAKVSIVTHKVQTTRAPVRGVAMRGAAQLVLIDTPGVFAPRRRLDRAMVAAAWTGAGGADAVVHLVDAVKGASEDVARIIEALKRTSRPAILALNKIDALPRQDLLALARDLHAAGTYGEVFMISALTGDGVEDLAAHLAAHAPPGPWLFPEDQTADIPARLLAAEITREKMMLRLHDELPYEATVETDSWTERRDGSARVEQTLYVARESQRKIAIGENGAVIKAISQAARQELEALLDKRIHLFLHVKVREGWSEDRARYREMGLDWDA